MDWNLAIEKNREALKRILAMLVAMAGLVDLRACHDAGVTGGGGNSDPSSGNRPATLPRHLHRFLLRLLRPAEAATRRLIIVAARGLVAELSPPRPRDRKPVLSRRNGFGTGMVLAPGPLPDWAKALAPKRSSTVSLPLLDPLKRFGIRRRYVKPALMPRIRSFDDPRIGFFQQPRAPDPLPPSLDDPLHAGRLHRRLEALASALDDLPGQARRLARWRARREAALAQDRAREAAAAQGTCIPGVRGEITGAYRGTAGTRRKVPFQRLSPMRPGRPPGWRRQPDHDVYDVLNELHSLAVWARDGP